MQSVEVVCVVSGAAGIAGMGMPGAFSHQPLNLGGGDCGGVGGGGGGGGDGGGGIGGGGLGGGGLGVVAQNKIESEV